MTVNLFKNLIKDKYSCYKKKKNAQLLAIKNANVTSRTSTKKEKLGRYMYHGLELGRGVWDLNTHRVTDGMALGSGEEVSCK